MGSNFIPVLSEYFSGLGLRLVSGIRDFLRFIDAIWDASSTNFTCIPLFLDIGLGIGGLKHAPLNFTINKTPPSQVPALNPPGKHFLFALLP